MPRPKKCRRIEEFPDVTYFKPRGVPLRELNEVYLPIEGFEALRLIDVESMNQEEASTKMQVSRQTFGRILSGARRTVAKALVEAMAIRIDGGNYAFSTSDQNPAAHETMASRPDSRTNDNNLRQFDDPTSMKEKERYMNKIAITSDGPTLGDQVDPRFGRAAGFIVIDLETMDFEYIDNGASQAMAQGAGIQAAEIVAGSGVQAILTGYVGPKAYMALEAAGIRVAQNIENMTVAQAIERFKQGQVEWAGSPNKQGHGK